MGVSLRRFYDLEVAHSLNAGVGEHHKCRRLHGHRYEVTVEIGGELDGDGMLVEYDSLDRVIGPVLRLVDHYFLNELSSRCSTSEAAAIAANSTVERLVTWLGARLSGIVASAVPDRKLRLLEVSAKEDARAEAVWRP